MGDVIMAEMRNVDIAGMKSMENDLKRNMHLLIEIAEEFRKLDPEMPIQYFAGFLYIAMNKGLSVGELMQLMNISQSAASRNVSALSTWQKFEKPGLGLIELDEDKKDRRRKIAELNASGNDLLYRLNKIVERHTIRAIKATTKLN
jgi:DNA-binding MarR family transcriptional regulator